MDLTAADFGLISLEGEIPAFRAMLYAESSRFTGPFRPMG